VNLADIILSRQFGLEEKSGLSYGYRGTHSEAMSNKRFNYLDY
jgi:hypothetical protein